MKTKLNNLKGRYSLNLTRTERGTILVPVGETEAKLLLEELKDVPGLASVHNQLLNILQTAEKKGKKSATEPRKKEGKKTEQGGIHKKYIRIPDVGEKRGE